MGLKLLMVPFSILITFAIIIGFIKPDYTALQEKRTTYAAKLAQAGNMDTLLSNIDALTLALDGQPETERFVLEYFPRKIDQGRVIDMLNFLASRSGVAVVIMNLNEVEENGLPDTVVAETIMPGVTVGAIEGAPVPPPLPEIRPKAFSAQVTVKGRYENIKEFLGRLAHMNRMHKTRNFFVETEKQGGGSGEDNREEVGILTGSFMADFDFFDIRPNQDALYDPVFLNSTFDMSPFETISSWVTEEVPLLEKPATGRLNPFQ